MMHKHINTNADKMQVQWQNNSYKGNIYNKVYNTKHTRGAHSIKFKNLSYGT